MTYSRETAMYKEQTFHKGDVVRMLVVSAFMDCIILGFGKAEDGKIYAKLARPYAYVSKHGSSVLTGIEYIEYVSIESLDSNYKLMDTGRII